MPLSLLEGALGGIGLFLLGMRIMSEGIRTVADDRIRSIFSVITSNRFYATLFGILLSFSLNSVSAAVIFSIGLLNGGVLNAFQALSVLGGVLIGAVLALHVPGIPYSFVATPLIFIGVLLKFFARRRRLANSGDLLLGAGLLFLGLTLLEGSFRPYESHPFYNAFNGVFFSNHLLATFFGAMVSCFVQSSTSLTSVITSLVSSYSVDPETASEMVLGGYVGVAVIGVLASIGGASVSRNVASAFLGINIIVTLVLITVIHYLLDIEYLWKVAALCGTDSLHGTLALVYTASGLLTSAVAITLSGPLARFIGVVSNHLGKGVVTQPCAGYLDTRILNTPTLAIEQARKEIVRMLSVTSYMFADTREILFDYDARRAETIKQHEQVLDSLNHEITSFLASLSKSTNQPDIAIAIPGLLQTVTDLEHIGDRCEGILSCIITRKDVGVLFSDLAMADLKLLTVSVADCITTLESYLRDGETPDTHVLRVIKENTRRSFDDVRVRHFERMSSGECSPRAAILYNDIVFGLMRIFELSWNIMSILCRRAD